MKTNSIFLISYVVKKPSGKRNVFVLSTMHKNMKVARDIRKKPNVIAFYDRAKRSVNVIDIISGTFTTKC